MSASRARAITGRPTRTRRPISAFIRSPPKTDRIAAVKRRSRVRIRKAVVECGAARWRRRIVWSGCGAKVDDERGRRRRGASVRFGWPAAGVVADSEGRALAVSATPDGWSVSAGVVFGVGAPVVAELSPEGEAQRRWAVSGPRTGPGSPSNTAILSAGVSQPSVLRGRPLSSVAISSSAVCRRALEDRCPWAGTGAAARWCSRCCRAATASVDSGIHRHAGLLGEPGVRGQLAATGPRSAT